jgi:hypothetical protein
VHAVSEFASASGQLTGAEPQYNGIRFLPLKQGRWLNDLDETQKRDVVVLGDEMSHNLFPGRPAIGSFILLNGHRFEVVGTLNRVGRGDDNSTNTRAYIPFQVMRSDFPLKGEEAYDAISFLNYQPRVADEHLLARTRRAASSPAITASTIRDEDAFEGWDTVKQAQMMGTIFDTMDEFLGTVGLVTLGARRHRRRQHHAGRRLRAHPRNRSAQSPGRHQSQHHAAIFCRRLFCSRWSADSSAWPWLAALWGCSAITTFRAASIRRDSFPKARSSPSPA